jgi:murein DD-endopeptidase MepM/ murein hydrolase activator NlpD
MQFYWPVASIDPTKIPSGYKFAYRRSASVLHPGLDLGEDGDIVMAAAAGTVSAAGWAKSGEGGVLVYIDHDANWQTRYFHMAEKLLVTKGDVVSAGQQIGNASKTGISNSPAHLHFEIRYKGSKPPKACSMLSSDGGWYLCDPLKLLKNAIPFSLIVAAIAVGYLIIRKG